MKPEVPFLPVNFTYDHTSGMFYAHLENGSIIPVSRNDISGKLENTLKLFAKGVIAQLHSNKLKKLNDDKELIAQAIQLGVHPKKEVLDDLLDF